MHAAFLTSEVSHSMSSVKSPGFVMAPVMCWTTASALGHLLLAKDAAVDTRTKINAPHLDIKFDVDDENSIPIVGL